MPTTVKIRSLRDFGNKVQNEAVCDLASLCHIETPIDSMDRQCKTLGQADAAADQFIRLLRESTLSFEGDEGNLVTLFEQARDAIGSAYQMWSKKHLCAINPELTADDRVVEAYAQLLTIAAALHDKLNTLCWIIGEQQADQDRKLPGSFTNASDLFSAMGV